MNFGRKLNNFEKKLRNFSKKTESTGGLDPKIFQNFGEKKAWFVSDKNQF